MERTGRVRLISKNSFWESHETSVGKCVPPRSWPGFLRNCGEARCLCGKSSQKEDVKGPWCGEAYRLREQLSGRPVELRIWFICILTFVLISSWKFGDLNVFCKYKHFLCFLCQWWDLQTYVAFFIWIIDSPMKLKAVSSSFDLGRFLSVMLTFPPISLLFLRLT